MLVLKRSAFMALKNVSVETQKLLGVLGGGGKAIYRLGENLTD